MGVSVGGDPHGGEKGGRGLQEAEGKDHHQANLLFLVDLELGQGGDGQGEDDKVGDDVHDAVAHGRCEAQAAALDLGVPESLQGDALDEAGDKDPDVADHDDAQYHVDGDALGAVDHDAHVEEEDRHFGAGQAHGVEEEAVELFLQGVGLSAPGTTTSCACRAEPHAWWFGNM